MAIAHSVSLGEINPKKNAKFLKVPNLKVDFDFNTDTGHQVSDEQVKKGIDKLAPKILAGHVKSRLKDIEKALAQVDKDIEKELKAFRKQHGISEKAKTLTPEQDKAQNDFLNKMSAKVERLQAYLNQIVDGINKSDSLKWVEECYDKVFDKLKKAFKGRQLKRASGGRAKIVIMALIGIAVTALVVVATVMTGGLALGVIAGVAGIALTVIATCGKTVINLIKTRHKFRQSMTKLKTETEACAVLVKKCEDAVKGFREADKAWLKKAGLTEKAFKQNFGTSKPDADRLYPLLEGHKRTMTQFKKHQKDVEALFGKIVAGLRDTRKAKDQANGRHLEMAKKLKEAIGNGEPMTDKQRKAVVDGLQKSQAELAMAEEKLRRAEADVKAVGDVISAARVVSDGFDKYKVVASKVKGTTIKMSQVETAFGTLDDLGKHMKSVGGDMVKIDKALNA